MTNSATSACLWCLAIVGLQARSNACADVTPKGGRVTVRVTDPNWIADDPVYSPSRTTPDPDELYNGANPPTLLGSATATADSDALDCIGYSHAFNLSTGGVSVSNSATAVGVWRWTWNYTGPVANSPRAKERGEAKVEGEVDIETGSGSGNVAAVGFVQYESTIFAEDEAVLTESAKATSNSPGPTISYFGGSYTVTYSEGQGQAQDEDKFIILAEQQTVIYSHRVQSEARVEASAKAGGIVDGVLAGNITLEVVLDSAAFPYVQNPLVPWTYDVIVIPVGEAVDEDEYGVPIYDAEVRVNDYTEDEEE